jgi:hypothetical protein
MERCSWLTYESYAQEVGKPNRRRIIAHETGEAIEHEIVGDDAWFCRSGLDSAEREGDLRRIYNDLNNPDWTRGQSRQRSKSSAASQYIVSSERTAVSRAVSARERQNSADRRDGRFRRARQRPRRPGAPGDASAILGSGQPPAMPCE